MIETYTARVSGGPDGVEGRIRGTVDALLVRAEGELGAPVVPRSVSVWSDGGVLMVTAVVETEEQRFTPLGGV